MKKETTKTSYLNFIGTVESQNKEEDLEGYCTFTSIPKYLSNEKTYIVTPVELLLLKGVQQLCVSFHLLDFCRLMLHLLNLQLHHILIL